MAIAGCSMHIGILFVIIVVAGSLGGLANCLVAKEFAAMGRDDTSGVWRPGWLGNVLVGAIAALVVWCVYGPLATYDVFAGASAEQHLTFFQVGSSIVVGLGGGSLLTKMAQAQADSVAKMSLANFLESAYSKALSGEKNFLGAPKDERKKHLTSLLADFKKSGSFESAAIAAQISGVLSETSAD